MGCAVNSIVRAGTQASPGLLPFTPLGHGPASPRAAEGLDEADRGDVLLGEDLGVAEFDEQAGAFGVEEFDLADEPAVVALSDEVLGLTGGGEGFGERG